VLSRRGWLLLALAAGLAIAGRLLGIEELFLLGAAALALVCVAIIYARRVHPSVTATRTLHPSRVYAGSDSRVELSVRNLGLRRTPVLSVRDPFDRGRRQARFLLAPLHPGESARAAYRLPTAQRGVYSLGPLEISFTDAFGLATSSETVAAETQLTVYPHVDVISPLPHTLGHDPLAGADHPNALASRGEDFYALRAYQVGDDLRRVHWPSTARRDDLMIRQDEMPWQGRSTVFLDTRRSVHTGESFELAVSATASIISACWRRRALVRLVTSDGADAGWSASPSHIEALMEHLATVRPSRNDRFADVITGLRRAGNGGAMAAVTAAVKPDDLSGISHLKSRFDLVTIVVFEASAYDASLAGRLGRSPHAGAGGVMYITGEKPFAQVWNEAMSSRKTALAR
jgi:uncharacterized protein (DUF58 family)